jgi:hypothetical protein
MSTSAPKRRPPVPGTEQWTIRGLVSTHPTAALVAAGLIAILVGTFLFVALGAKAGAVTDGTTCTQWGSANDTRQTAYAELYVREHGPVPRWGSSPAEVIAAINTGCDVAYGDDVADQATVVQAIRGTF